MKCINCGAETMADKCEYCGSEMPKERVQQNVTIINNIVQTNIGSGLYVRAKAVSSKSKGAAIALCCLSFIGLSGMHRFYVGKKVSGFLHLFTFGYCLIGTIIDLIALSKGKFTDVNGLPLR